MKKHTYKFKAFGCGGRGRKYKDLDIKIQASNIDEAHRAGVKEFKKLYHFEPEDILIERTGK